MKNTILENKEYLKLFFTIVILFLQIYTIYAAIPSGATNLTSISNTTALADFPESVSAVAGNVTEINIFGYSTTQSWQGYFGNVTGVIELTDGNNRTMFNWSSSSPRGEVYASNESGVIWTNIQCFNFTANGTNCNDDINNRGGTSKCGMNLSQLEGSYNVDDEDIDGVNETFNRNDHELFYTNNLEFSAGECKNSKILNETGQGIFDEVLLWSPDSNAVVFTSLLKNNVFGFNGKSYDFEMLVLEDGHETDVDITNYYFYIELQ